MEVSKEKGYISVQIEYNPYYVEQLKQLGGKWQAKDKTWHLATNKYEKVVELLNRSKNYPTEQLMDKDRKSVV